MTELPQEALDYYLQVEREENAISWASNPLSVLSYVCFLSNSKGRGRRRKYPAEVELITDKRIPRTYTWNRFPFDDKATEILKGVENPEGELMRRIPLQCRKD